MYEIILSNKAEKELKKLDKGVRDRIINSLKRIRVRPENYLTRLVGDQIYKLRVGDYRILMDIDKGNLLILVLKVSYRRNVYKSLTKL
ncbi:MAG: type II toxin-antitoxin system RelE/ParE family toxin [Nanoarchaeota archaeon]|nr:type II toxin-antitoxin system RelE/ParE family toxin [Nanoarchaeota archaeon]MBU1643786.1 type II toxin-antitoxin system RelE/ParE family toxin [Nanoarchaeota archaeon]MBU1977057.1 type II toxin-antitoxin system RelE/ParE family toxin [Nanoarchaeota archaeon]